MDEQRMQAYVKLIEQLLGCAPGEQSVLLQANADLVDAGLVAVMGQVAIGLESQGNNDAVWLRRFSAQLGQSLGLEPSAMASPSAQDAVGFVVEILQLIEQAQGSRVQVYNFFRANLAQLDETVLQALPIVFESLIQKNDPFVISALLEAFGNLIQMFPLGGQKLNLEMSITAYELALQVGLRETFPEQWAMMQNRLANSYFERIQGERADNLERAIAAYEQALQVTTREEFPEDWAATHTNLANAYANRIRGEHADNLEQAIASCKLALQVLTHETSPEDWAATHTNLAIAYANRIQGERADNLECAIASYELALQVRTREEFPEQWARTQNNLANAYSKRIRGEQADNLERAITTYEQALQVRTREEFPVQWATTQNNLANAYFERIRGERANNLERAITAYEQALQVYTRDAFPADWARTQNNLASTYSNRIRGERADNLEQAITAYEQALQVCTRDAFPADWAMTQNNLARAYSNRIRGERADNLERAISSYELALQVYTQNNFPKNCRQTARTLGSLYFEPKDWINAVSAYETALSAAENLYQACIFLDGKVAELTETGDLPRCAAYALAQIGNLSQAAEILEQGRARGLSETLNRDRTNLDNLKAQNETLYTQYQEITQQLRTLEAQQRDLMTSIDRHSITPETLRDEATRLRQELTTTIDQIRQQPGYETFLTLPTFADAQKAATPDSPLIYLVTTSAGSLALSVTPDTTNHLWLDNFTDTELTEIIRTWFAAYNNVQSDRQAWYNTIEETTKKLWEPIMGPLVQKLQELSCDRITLIPTGYLNLLPLHAAWTKDLSSPTGRRYAFDDIHITYAPNAKSLTAAQSIANRVQVDSILAIDNPSQDLENSEREVQAAIDSFLPQATILRHHRATTTAVKTALPQASIAHFSCHGTANLNEPLNSGLAMSDGLLTLKDIFALNLAGSGLRLAILSACETGIQGLENADEAISLPTGLLQAGVAAVISSLWSVDDRSTRILLTRFYDLWRKEHLESSVALRQAQLWMKDTSSQQKAKYFEETHPDLFQALILLPPNHFAHPFHWAAFGYTGV